MQSHITRIVPLTACRQRACAVRRHSRSYYLTVGSLAASLGAAEGDTLCFTPTGKGAAAVQLLKAPTAVAAGAAARAQAAAAAAAAGTASAAPATAAAGAPGADELEPGESDGESDGESGSGIEEQPDPEESAGLEQSGTTEGGSQEHSLVSGSEYEPPRKRRRRRQREGSGSAEGSKPVGASVNWSGLEDGQVDRGMYTLTLPAAAFKSGGNLKIQTPGVQGHLFGRLGWEPGPWSVEDADVPCQAVFAPHGCSGGVHASARLSCPNSQVSRPVAPAPASLQPAT